MRLTTLKLRRLERGMLQVQIAHAAGISRARLSEIENGHVVPRRDELERLARTLGVAAESLVGATEEKMATTK